METPKLTRAEMGAIKRLQKLADTFPKSLMLFSNSGNLQVMKLPEGSGEPLRKYVVATISGIANDGGDSD